MVPPVHVLVIEHHMLVREALRHMLPPGFVVVAEASTCDEGVRFCLNGLRPDIAVVDFDLPEMTGIETTYALLNVLPALRVVILIGTPDDELIAGSIRVGAEAVITKTEPPTILIEALMAIAAGRSYLSMAASQRIVSRIRAGRDQTVNTKELRPRELQVCRLIAKGLTNKEIANTLKKPDGSPLQVESVRSYRKNAMKKLGARNGAHLTNIMLRERILLLTATPLED